MWTKQDLDDAPTFAKDNSLFPPTVELCSDFHVEFLFHHFMRDAPRERQDTALKNEWKKAIRANLDVLSDSIGLMRCGPCTFDLVEGARPVKTRPYPLSPIKKMTRCPR